MILFRIATGFYTWDVYKWLSVFLFVGLAAGLLVSIAVRRHGGRLIHEAGSTGTPDASRTFDIERFAAALTKIIIEPWAALPSCGLTALAVLTIFLAAAIFCR